MECPHCHQMLTSVDVIERVNAEFVWKNVPIHEGDLRESDFPSPDWDIEEVIYRELICSLCCKALEFADDVDVDGRWIVAGTPAHDRFLMEERL